MTADERFDRKYPDVARRIHDQELVERFSFHPAAAPQMASLYEQNRQAGLEFARLLNSYCPNSRELWRAIDAIDMAVMWANAAIARHG